MGARNALFRKAKYLLEIDGLSKDEATEQAYAALIKTGRGNHLTAQIEVTPLFQIVNQSHLTAGKTKF